tara:strand:- start:25 stop:435 length:411 start_codon:yes stop_codon:yes gene_type:complete
MKNISEHITYEEATTSPTALRLGITNEPSAEVLANMVRVAEACFEPLRKSYGKPIKVNSFYRCTLLNEAVKGSKTSDHVKGRSIDLTAGSKEENKKLFDWCKANLKYDQLINEYNYSWVHISFNSQSNRNQTLIIT